MKSLFLLFSFVSSYAFAQNYTFLGFENATYRDFTREEFVSRLGENALNLKNYECDSINELNPFLTPLRINDNEDSLKIKAKDSEKIFIYKKGKFFNQEGEEVVTLRDSFLKTTAQMLKVLEGINVSHQLLRMLETSHFPLTIKYGMNSFVPTVEGGRNFHGIKMAQSIAIIEKGRTSDDSIPFSDIGVGGFISWHPNDPSIFMEADGVERTSHDAISLAHEMYHAFDSIRGLLDLQFVQGDEYEFATRSEYRAVYFENLIRYEMGFQYRKFYGNNSGADLLNDQNEPISIPAPCLNH